MITLTKEYWEGRYAENQTGWDVGSISKPLKDYIDQLENKDLRVLIPGAGNAYELEYLWEQGFTNAFVLDIAAIPLENLQKRNPKIPKNHLIETDFFQWNETYDLILEQTFFCALDPNLRAAYAQKMASLLRPNGKLVGLLFDTDFGNDFPPFGGNKEEYFSYFTPYFDILTFEKCHNSIAPRAGKELFFIFQKK
ncbi:MAG: methyltransferase domain-containing protein [Flavobacterium sp.]